jgi:biopolymer transport protein ExbD
MSRRHRRGGMVDRPKASIDMNSLIDLTFLLLVTFILTIPALEQGISIILPRGKTDTLQVKEHKPATITIDAENRYFLDKSPTTLEALEKELLAKVAADPESPVLVRGDERLSYGAVMDVVKLVYKCKVKRMSLVTVEK